LEETTITYWTLKRGNAGCGAGRASFLHSERMISLVILACQSANFQSEVGCKRCEIRGQALKKEFVNF
jgi:hypothetical protein